jgi:hypothetical protein
VLGRQVRAARMSVAPSDENETHFDLRGLPRGSYILRLTSGGRTTSVRFEIE